MEIFISGKVIHGEHYGKILGFPTANLDRREYARKKMKIRLGVWAGEAVVRDKATGIRRFKAGIVIGPKDKSGLPKIEAHLVGFKGNLYGKHLITYLITYLRPFRKFKNAEELKRQIAEDVKKIKSLRLKING